MPLFSTLNYLLHHPLARRTPLYTLLHYAYWQISTRVQAQPLVVSWIGGTRLWFQRNWLGISGNLYTGLHEFVERVFVLHLLRGGEGRVGKMGDEFVGVKRAESNRENGE